MEIINCPEIEAHILKNGIIHCIKSKNELSIFSSIFIDSQQSDPI